MKPAARASSAPAIAVLCGFAALLAARGIRELAKDADEKREVAEPYAPSADAAPYVSLGYRELVADLLFARLTTYVGGHGATANGIASLCEAIAATDDHHRRAYDWCARAITVGTGVDQSIYRRAIALLEKGMEVFPDDWRIPNTAGQMYLTDLATDDPVQRRQWDERAASLLEAATRKPHAPAGASVDAAILRTRLGQHQRAVESLREMLLVTSDAGARKEIIGKLAELQKTDAIAVAADVLEMRRRFEERWHRERPAIGPSMYVLLGPHAGPGFEMGDLATGGHDLVEPPPPPDPPPQ